MIINLKRAIVHIFKHKKFQQWAKTESIADVQLKEAVAELSNGLFDAGL